MAFTTYRWKKLTYIFKSTSADLVSGTNGALGTVMLATDYNSVENNFSDKKTMANYEGTTASKPSMSVAHYVKCNKKMPLYTRDHEPPANADRRLYDIGKFSIATEGMQATSGTIGELWVDYEIEFYKPRFDIDAQVESSMASSLITGSFNLSNKFGSGSTSRWARGNTDITINNNHISFASTQANKIFFVTCLWQGASTATLYRNITQDVTPGATYTVPTAVAGFAINGTASATPITTVDATSSTVVFQGFFQMIPDGLTTGLPFHLYLTIGSGSNFPGTLTQVNVHVLEVNKHMLDPLEQVQ